MKSISIFRIEEGNMVAMLGYTKGKIHHRIRSKESADLPETQLLLMTDNKSDYKFCLNGIINKSITKN